jgi:fatty acid-binding protein DegV
MLYKREETMNIRIVTDSTCDLPEEIISQQEITVVPLYINVGEESYLDGANLTRAEFYARLTNIHFVSQDGHPRHRILYSNL